MPIEDVDFLKKNSKQQSYMFLVDSSTRDRYVYPQPSEYTITFTAPFHNVVGLEVLHGSIPRSMYNVDIYNNTLSFLIYEDIPGTRDIRLNPQNYSVVTLTPGEYTIQTLTVELNRVMQMHLNGDTNRNIVNIVAETESSPPELTNKLRFRCTYPFAMNMNASTIAETLGFDTYAERAFIEESPSTLTTSQKYMSIPFPSQSFITTTIQNIWTTMNSSHALLNVSVSFAEQMPRILFESIVNHMFYDTEYRLSFSKDYVLSNFYESPVQSLVDYLCKDGVPQNYRMYRSVDLPPSKAMGQNNIIFDGPRGVVRRLQVTSTQQVAQQFTLEDRGYLTQVYAALTTDDGTVKLDSKAYWSLYTNVDNAPGEEIPLQRINESGATVPAQGIIPISMTDGGLCDPAYDVFVSLDPGVYWIVFRSTNDDTFVYFNDVPANQKKGEMKVKTAVSNTWMSTDTEEGIHFELSIRVITQDEYHYLTAPGIYSLIGERYVVLRCPEIEENSYRSLAYGGNCLGLAKFQLGVVGYSENRLDFSKVPTREFHPIGKLQKITLRFETASGKLYDFKGVNHNITFAIHYYEPIQINQFQQSILNPNYNADIINYMYRQDDQDQDSDDQDYEYDQDDLQEYRQQEARHLPENVGRLNYEALYRMNLDLDDA